MVRGIILVLCFALFVPFAAYASEVSPETPLMQLPVTSPAIEKAEKILSKEHGIISDYSSNQLASDAVNKHVSIFTETIRERFSMWLTRSGKYLELMKRILKEKDVPEEIVFLSLIESGFSPYAYSPASAAGYWQFISSTAKRYGLEIDWWRDERRDPVKSTVAAADYLKDLYEMFGSWNLAMAAYNAGEGRILRALNKSQAEDYWSLLKTDHIRSETKNYVPKFIAASMIANSPKTFGFEELEYQQPLNYDTVVLNSPVDIEVIARCAETTEKVIKELNPELRRWCTPPGDREYALRIPEGQSNTFYGNLAQIADKDRFTVDVYTAKKGDTFKSIARKTGVPMQAILDLNDMEKIMPLKTGMAIYLPPKDKCVPDKEDKRLAKKASLKSKKYIGKKKKVSKKSLKKKILTKKSKKLSKTVSHKTRKKSPKSRTGKA